jgi:hypothetical protein
MPVCNCSLAGTKACENCMNLNKTYTLTLPLGFYDMSNKRTSIRTIEKFDKDGKIIERITEYPI